MPPEGRGADAASVLRLLTTIRRRLWLARLLRALAHGVVAATLVLVVAAIMAPARAAPVAGLALASIAALQLWRGRAGRDAAAQVERAMPKSRNSVFTAYELITQPGGVAPWMARRAIASAAAIAGRASPPSIVPLRGAVLWLIVVVGLLMMVAVNLPRLVTSGNGPAGADTAAAPASMPPAAVAVVATVTPPSYTRRAATTLNDPAQLEIVQGSQVTLTVRGGEQLSVRFGSRALALAEVSVGIRRTELVPDESGYFAIEDRRAAGERKLLPVSVVPDRAPAIRLEDPGKDLLMPDAGRSVPVIAAATDDFGLDGLELRYTKVSGSGEQFEFVEGTLPLQVVRDSPRSWNGRGRFDLTALGLTPGDSLVYRAVARDSRPGAGGTAASDTFFIEVAGPAQVALPGFELPPDRERYAYSQQMVVLKLERLRPREPSLTTEVRDQEVATIAAEQRAVRSNFIFLMGGHVEDEEEEAAHSNEIQEGRLENSARREISTAIQFMSHVEQALAAGDTRAALPPARSAASALQRAFGRNRYFLRTLATRSRLDPSRRLSGELKEASGSRRQVEPATLEAKAEKARALLARVLELAPGGPVGSSTPAAVATLAEEALAVDPGNPAWQQISAALVTLRDALTAARPDDVRRAVQEAAAPLLRMVRISALRSADDEGAGALTGAWADEVRRR